MQRLEDEPGLEAAEGEDHSPGHFASRAGTQVLAGEQSPGDNFVYKTGGVTTYLGLMR